MPRDDALVLDIAEAAGKVSAFVSGLDHDAFIADDKTIAAVIYELIIIGEAVKRLSAPFRERHQEVRWSDIARMRDRLIHHYNRVDPEVVWDTACGDVPELRQWIERMGLGS